MSADMYATLDALIVKAVSESNATPLYQADVVAEGERIAGITSQFGFRVIDGRIQALRRKGVIRFLRSRHAPGRNAGWYLGDSVGGGA